MKHKPHEVTWADNQTEGEMLEEVSDYMRQIQAWADLYDQEPPPMSPEAYGVLLDEIAGGEASWIRARQ